ncbi:ParB N-terminal domain-containing protein [Methylocystis sp.]|uniref:ParB N-terminal domain-containing protein n=1 Tax=Methylocystis sp. TaxID=1911079 RepID=UPI0025E7A3EE|nr:ParB N-terminal domain-containing protein [Methylocystis sp.]
MELRTVNPRNLKPNPDNPRRTAAGEHADQQLVANIKAIGITQPPVVRAEGEDMVVVAGDRRVRAAIAAGLSEILVLVRDGAHGDDNVRSLSENVVRAQMGPVDQWRAIEALISDDWTEEAIGTALALPVRTIKKLRLLAHIHPAVLDHIAKGDMPQENHLRTIAAASADEQASVWKKHKPKKGQPTVSWWEVARALEKRRIYAKAAKFGPDEELAFGIVWEEDLFEQGGEDTRYTTQVEAFFAAQTAWLDANLPKNGVVLAVDEHGRAKLPAKAEQVWSTPKKSDTIGHYVDSRDGSIKEIVFRQPKPEPKKDKKGSLDGESEAMAPAKTRPDITQKGLAMIGDYRTEALAKTLADDPIDDIALLGALVLAFGASNVEIRTGDYSRDKRDLLVQRVTEGGRLTQDIDILRRAARDTLTLVLSLRPGNAYSGIAARFVGDAIGADAHLPNMATEDFLKSLSKAALEHAASTLNVLPRQRAKDTRAALLEQVGTGTFVLPAAHFAPTEDELTAQRARAQARAYDYDYGDDEEIDDNGENCDETRDRGNDEADAPADAEIEHEYV